MKTQHMWKLTISNYISILETKHNHVYNHNNEMSFNHPAPRPALPPTPRQKKAT